MIKNIFEVIKKNIKKIHENYIIYNDTCRYQDTDIKKEFVFMNIRRIIPFCVICNGILLLYTAACLSSLKTDPARLYFLIANAIYFTFNLIFSVCALKVNKGENTNFKNANQLILLFYLLTFSLLLTLNILEIYHYQTFYNLFILCSVISFSTFMPLKLTLGSLIIAVVASLIALPGTISGIQIVAIFIPIFIAFSVSQLLYFNNKRYLIATKKLNNKNNALELKLKTDHLTNVHNRYGLETHTSFLLPYAIRSKTPISIIMIDIDLFKSFNDTFGHLEGDICLTKIAKGISNSVKSDTDIVSRFGGEEFLVFCYNVTEEETIIISKRIEKAILQLKIKSATEIVSKYVTISMGIANGVLTSKEDYHNLIKKADIELYNAKQSGRNAIFIKGNKVK